MVRSWRRSIVARACAGLLAFLFTGCAASQVDNAPEGSTLTFSPSDWSLTVSGTLSCSAIVNRRAFVVTLRGPDGDPLNDVPVTITSFNPAFPLFDPSTGLIMPGDPFGVTSYTRDTDANGNVIVNVAIFDCETEDDIVASSGTAVGSGHITVGKATGSTNVAPTASFTVTPNPATVGASVTFDGSGSSDDGTIVSYTWDFGDGTAPVTTTAPTSSTTHMYSTIVGSPFTATLTVTDNGGLSSSTTVPVTVN